MERTTFNQEMARLSVAFDRVLTAPQMSTYWDRVRGHRDDLFIEATDRLIDEGETFPTIATLHRVYYERRDARRDDRREAAMPQDAALSLGRRNAVRLAHEGLPSDVMMQRGGGITHRVGSRQHGAIVAMYDRMIATIERQLDERAAQADMRPGDHETARRVEVLARTLGETVARRAHFADTGETLPMANLAPDAVAAHPGTFYLCPVCRATDDAPSRFIRVDVSPGSAHFGKAIPCPRCRPVDYGAYIAAKGRPLGLPGDEGTREVSA